jgi:hypothetical protein
MVDEYLDCSAICRILRTCSYIYDVSFLFLLFLITSYIESVPSFLIIILHIAPHTVIIHSSSDAIQNSHSRLNSHVNLA